MTSSTTASEKRIIGWIEDMIDEPLASSTDLSEALKDGIALCKLVNKIRAGSVPYINTNPGVLNHLENISAYLQACWTLGVPTDAIFGTQDLFQRRNIGSVIKNLDSLAAVTVSNDSLSSTSEISTVTQNGGGSPSDTKTSGTDTMNDDLIAENEELVEENQNLRRRLRLLQETVEDNESTMADKDKEIADLKTKLRHALVQLQQAQEKVEALPANGTPEGTEEQSQRISQLELELEQSGKTQAKFMAKIQQLEGANAKLQQEVAASTQSSASQDGNDSDTASSLTNGTSSSARSNEQAIRERRNRRRSNALTRGDIARVERNMERDPETSPQQRPAEREKERDKEREKARERRRLEREALTGDADGSTSNRPHSVNTSPSSPPAVPPLHLRPSRSLDDERRHPKRVTSEDSVKAEDSPVSPRKKENSDSRSSSPKEEKRKNLAPRLFRGFKDRLGFLRTPKDDKVNPGNDLTALVRNIFVAPATVSFQDVVKVNFKKDTSRRLFSLILDQQMNSFTLQKSHGLTHHSFDMLLYLVNASLLAMGDDVETDTIALQVLMRSAFFFFFKKDKGEKQFMQEHVRSYDVWKRFEFWEEYFYSEVGHHAKLRKDDPKLVYTVLSEFVLRMKDFGVGGGLIQKLVNDVASKDLLTQDELATLLKSSNPTPPVTPSSIISPSTVPVMLRHNFSQKSTKKPAWCDFCSEFIWGVAKLVYFCSECKYTIHRKCLDECLPNAACSNKRTFGTPFAVSHNVSVTKNANGGYEGLPKEWQDLLEQSGIEKTDVLANPHAVLHILEYHTSRQKRGVTERLMPTANQRQPKPDQTPEIGMPQPETPRAGPGDDTGIAPVLDVDEHDDEPSLYRLDDIISLNDPTNLYKDITQIGQGANAQVFSGFSETGTKVAIKKLRWVPTKSQALINEIQILKSSKHKNVIQCSDCFLNNEELWVIMEYIDYGSLTDILDQYPRGLQMSEAEIAFICSQTLKALEYIHSIGIIHRDIKTDNILLGTDGRICLADFGSAARLSATRPNRKTVIGSPYWMAPELIRGEEYTQKVDIFSFGCTLRELAVGEPPFAEFPPLKTLFLLATSDVPPLKSVEGRKWSPMFLDFCNKCVRKDPAVRPGASDLLLHPFIGLACTQEEFTSVIQQAISYRDKVLTVFGNLD